MHRLVDPPQFVELLADGNLLVSTPDVSNPDETPAAAPMHSPVHMGAGTALDP